jgi:hypothetical protein
VLGEDLRVLIKTARVCRERENSCIVRVLLESIRGLALRLVVRAWTVETLSVILETGDSERRKAMILTKDTIQ